MSRARALRPSTADGIVTILSLVGQSGRARLAASGDAWCGVTLGGSSSGRLAGGAQAAGRDWTCSRPCSRPCRHRYCPRCRAIDEGLALGLPRRIGHHGRPVEGGLVGHLHARYRTAAQLLDALHAHALVEDAAVDHPDALDVAAAAKDLGVARWRNEEGAEARLQDGALGHEAVVRRGVQAEAAEADADACGEACLRRQRRPADIAAAVPPIDPRRCPDVAWHPAPAQRSVPGTSGRSGKEPSPMTHRPPRSTHSRCRPSGPWCTDASRPRPGVSRPRRSSRASPNGRRGRAAGGSTGCRRHLARRRPRGRRPGHCPGRRPAGPTAGNGPSGSRPGCRAAGSVQASSFS